jgi:nicotinamide-nucleotide amidase
MGIEMKAEILTIGDEILSGHIVDTNSTWIARHLGSIGVRVDRITSISDNGGSILAALREASLRADLILITGGLGPTKDDVTKKTLCDYFNTGLVFDECVYTDVRSFIASRKISENELQKLQAHVPRDCTIIRNRVGTAPGMWFEKENKVYVSMPGVPSEMKTMMQNDILSRIQSRFAIDVILYRSLLVTGISESNLALKLADWENSLPAWIKLSYLPQGGFIRLRLTFSGKNKEELERLADGKMNSLSETLKGYVFGFGEDNPEQILVDRLSERGLTLSIIEDGSRGVIAARITSIPGSSECLAGTAVALSDSARAIFTGIDNAVITKYGAGSRKLAEMAADRLRKSLDTDLAMATSAITSETVSGKPHRSLWVALVSATNAISESIAVPSDAESFVAGLLFASTRMIEKIA